METAKKKTTMHSKFCQNGCDVFLKVFSYLPWYLGSGISRLCAFFGFTSLLSQQGRKPEGRNQYWKKHAT